MVRLRGGQAGAPHEGKAAGDRRWPATAGGLAAAVSPDGSKVFVTGGLQPQGADSDMVTVAYRS